MFFGQILEKDHKGNAWFCGLMMRINATNLHFFQCSHRLVNARCLGLGECRSDFMRNLARSGAPVSRHIGWLWVAGEFMIE